MCFCVAHFRVKRLRIEGCTYSCVSLWRGVMFFFFFFVSWSSAALWSLCCSLCSHTGSFISAELAVWLLPDVSPATTSGVRQRAGTASYLELQNKTVTWHQTSFCFTLKATSVVFNISFNHFTDVSGKVDQWDTRAPLFQNKIHFQLENFLENWSKHWTETSRFWLWDTFILFLLIIIDSSIQLT